MTDIAHWLRRHDLGKYVEVFAENEIQLGDLEELTDEDIAAMGLPLGPRRRLQRAIRELDHYDEVPAAPDVPPAERAVEAERRQLTVMFCDLVGSVGLGQRMDVEDYRALLGQFRAAVVRVISTYQGFIARHQGDGVLVYFGYPEARENDAERAVRAGMDIVGAVEALDCGRPVQVRVGIATGEAVVGDLLATGSSVELAALGQTPNLAARLQGQAQPNQVVVSELTHRLGGALFQAQATEPLAMKGFDEAIVAYQIHGLGPAVSAWESAARPDLSPLVGRTAELALLRDRWDKAASGSGQVVVVSAEPGVGKSRLVQEFRGSIAPEPHTPIPIFCSPYHTSSALYPVVDVIRRNLLQDTGAVHFAPLDLLERWLAGLGMEASKHAQFLGPLLSIDVTARYPVADLPGAERRRRALEALETVVLSLTGQQAVVLIAEDLHWVDPTTLAFLDRLVSLARSEPMLLLATCRPEFAVPWRGEAHLTEHHLNHLTREECRSFVERISGGGIPAGVISRVVERTDGVPLYVEELSRVILESGTSNEIPPTLRDALTARLDRLGPAKEVAQAAAVLGRVFPSDCVAPVGALAPERVHAGLTALADAGLVHRIRNTPTGDHQFKHALVRDAAYDLLLRDTRQRMHLNAARALGRSVQTRPEVLAYHFQRGGDFERAWNHWNEAGDAAVKHGDNKEAANHYRHALETAEENNAPAPTCLKLTIRLAKALHLTGARTEADALCVRQGNLAASMAEPELRGHYHQVHGQIQSFLGQRARTHQSLQRALTLARQARSASLAGATLFGLGFEARFREDFPEARARFAEAVSELRSIEGRSFEDTGYLQSALYGLAIALCGLGSLSEARLKYGELEQVVAESGYEGLTHSADANAYIAHTAGQWNCAIAILENAIANDPPPFNEALMQFMRGRSYLARGDIQTATAVLESSLEKALRYRSKQVQLWVVNSLGAAYLEDGRLDAASECAQDGVARAGAAGIPATLVMPLTGRIAMARGDFGKARSDLSAALEFFAGRGQKPMEAQVRLWLASLHHALGEAAKARDQLEAARSLYRVMGAEGYVTRTRQLASELGVELASERGPR